MSEFFKVYRKKGFERTIKILSNREGNEFKEADFYTELKRKKIHLNEFYRSKDDLISCGVIGYKLNDNFEKILFLTDKGKQLKSIIDDINENIIVAKKKTSKKK